MCEVASEEEDSLCDLTGPDPDDGASPPPVVGSPLGGAMALTVAEVLVPGLLEGLLSNLWILPGHLKGGLMSPQRGHAGSLKVLFWRIKVHQVWALLEFPQLINSQVVETTRFDPKGVIPHCGEGWSTHLLYHLSEVSHVPQ